MGDECCFPLEWIPRILHHSPGTGLQRWNHSLTITVGTPALICSAMQGHANTGNGVTASLLCSAQAFIPWFSARLIILKEASHYCNYPAPKTWVTSFRTLCFTILAHPCSFIFCHKDFYWGEKKLKRKKLRDHEPQKTEYKNNRSREKALRVSKITRFWVWLFIYLARRTAYLHNPFSVADKSEGVGTSFFLCWQY